MLYEKVITATNYREAAQALQDAGYATDPGYAQKIIQVIETYSIGISMTGDSKGEVADGRTIYARNHDGIGEKIS